MKKITFSITLILAIFYTTLSFAQTPPKKGVTPPANFWELQQMIQSEYSKGYYADKFRERKQTRELISQGLLPESALVTVYCICSYPDGTIHRLSWFLHSAAISSSTLRWT
ncbi:MAG: hypothetical protein U5J96_01730 [Ignavibacteriaceae bacterium]|nr:hypothetical protein [Ignavibacteriaceae bacterium]